MNDQSFLVPNNTSTSLVNSEGAELSTMMLGFMFEFYITSVASPLSKRCLDSGFFQQRIREFINMTY